MAIENEGGGGTNLDRFTYPTRFAETIAVGAVGKDKLITEFSSRGPAVDSAAPGKNVLSTSVRRWSPDLAETLDRRSRGLVKCRQAFQDVRAGNVARAIG